MTPFDVATVESSLRGGSLRWQLHFFRSIGSTMDEARALPMLPPGEAALIVADEQLAGRGRLGRAWISPAGVNLYFTISLAVQLEVLRRMAMIAPLAVAEGIQAVTGLPAEIKWPNDVQIRGLKCSGVLIDSEVRGVVPVRTLIGIGIDVNQDVREAPGLAGIATSLSAELGATVSRERLLMEVVLAFEAQLLAVTRGEDVRTAWRARLNTLGRQVRLTGQALDLVGVAEDVDADGSLLVRSADGTLHTAAAGEISLRPA